MEFDGVDEETSDLENEIYGIEISSTLPCGDHDTDGKGEDGDGGEVINDFVQKEKVNANKKNVYLKLKLCL